MVSELFTSEHEGPRTRGEAGPGTKDLGSVTGARLGGSRTRVHLALAVQSEDVLVAIVVHDGRMHGIGVCKTQLVAFSRSTRTSSVVS
ncbi:hypothetical protein DC31_03120 [Microbacterium sp. CH12i]|nr:hypothetical protein DC31_03120 [Microbacterium sp. CH12i]